MKARKPSKTTRARKAIKDLALTGRGTAGKVVGGEMASQQQQNIKEKERIRNLQSLQE